MTHLRRLRHQQRRAQHGRQRPDPRAHRRVGRARVLDVRRRRAAGSTTRCWWDARRSRRCSRSWARSSTRSCGRRSTSTTCACASSRCRPPRRASSSSTTSSARTASTRSRATTCAARAACASSRTAATNCGKAGRPGLAPVPVLRGRDRGRPAVVLARPAPPARRHGRGRPRSSRADAAQRRHLTTDPEGVPKPNVPDPDPGEAGRVRAQPDRRDHRPLRAQGPAHRRAAAHDARPRSSPSSTTPSTRASRSSRSSSPSSPPARWSRWCSRATRP